MLIDRRVVFMFAAPDISILANWFYIYYLAKIQFFFRFIIYEDDNSFLDLLSMKMKTNRNKSVFFAVRFQERI